MKRTRHPGGTFALLLALFLLMSPGVMAAEGTEGEPPLGEAEVKLQAGDNYGHKELETAFGNFITDAARWYTGADIALIPVADLGNHLQMGPVTYEGLSNCLLRDMPLAVAELTAAEIYAIMEHSISHYIILENQTVDWETSEFDGFLQISGLQVTYNAVAPPGERIMSLTAPDGSYLEPDDRATVFTVVSTEEVFSGAYGYKPTEEYTAAGTEIEAAAAYISHLGTFSAPEDDGRIKILGTRVTFGGSARMLGGLIAVVALLAVCSSRKFRSKFTDD